MDQLIERNIRIALVQRRCVRRYFYLVKFSSCAVEEQMDIRNVSVPVSPDAPLISVHTGVVAAVDRELKIHDLGILQ